MLSIERLSIEAVLLVRLAKLCDVRGYFLESYNARAFAEAGIDVTFFQDNQSLSVEPGTIRSLHFQTPPEAQAKHIRVLRGSTLMRRWIYVRAVRPTANGVLPI